MAALTLTPPCLRARPVREAQVAALTLPPPCLRARPVREAQPPLAEAGEVGEGALGICADSERE